MLLQKVLLPVVFVCPHPTILPPPHHTPPPPTHTHTHAQTASIHLNQAFESDYPKLVRVFADLLSRIEQFSLVESKPSSYLQSPFLASTSKDNSWYVGVWVSWDVLEIKFYCEHVSCSSPHPLAHSFSLSPIAHLMRLHSSKPSLPLRSPTFLVP